MTTHVRGSAPAIATYGRAGAAGLRPATRQARLAVAAAGLGLGLAACGADAGEPGADAGPDPAAVTFYEDVAPILLNHCASCHEPGGIAPFPLLTLDDALAAAPLLPFAVESRQMPPFGADNGGDCHTWEDARWLADDDIAAIVEWAEGDRAAGDPASAPARPAEPPALARVDATLDIGVTYTPDAQLADDYRCFVVDYDIPETKFLTAFEVRPGEPRVVHHILVFGLQSAQAVADAEQLDAADAGPGYSCFGGAGVEQAPLLGVWAPGVRVNRYPGGTGLPAPATGKMVVQIHYNLQAGPLPDRTRIDLELADAVDKQAFLSLVADLDMALPPGQERVATSGTLLNIFGNFDVWAVYPHMHTLGRSLRLERERGADRSCMLDVPRWDFDWQQFFNYADGPVAIDFGDVVRVTCAYDTRGRTETVTWGEGTLDEMCLSFLYTTPR